MTPRLGLIGGYLGSGKSTLVNRLLAGALPGRTAVVVNDFGSVNIDADLIVSAEEDTIELSNGCICCQLGDDVSRTMTALAARGDLDNVICEVSGVGDPGELAAWRSYPGFSPGPVVVCADATNLVRLLRNEYVADTVRRQLGSAEVVLVTKTDLATTGELAAAVAACGAAAPRAVLIPQDPADPQLTAARALATTAAAGEPAPAVADAHADVHATRTVTFTGPIELEVLVRVLSARPEALVRAKGFVRDATGSWHEVHLAAGRVGLTRRAGDLPAPGQSRLVLISAGADRVAVLDDAVTELGRTLGAVAELLAPETRGFPGTAGD